MKKQTFQITKYTTAGIVVAAVIWFLLEFPHFIFTIQLLSPVLGFISLVIILAGLLVTVSVKTINGLLRMIAIWIILGSFLFYAISFSSGTAMVLVLIGLILIPISFFRRPALQ